MSLNEMDLHVISLAPNDHVKNLMTKFLSWLRPNCPNGEFHETHQKDKSGVVWMQKTPNNFVGVKYLNTRSYFHLFVFSNSDIEEFRKNHVGVHWTERRGHGSMKYIHGKIEDKSQLESAFNSVRESYFYQLKAKTRTPVDPWMETLGTTNNINIPEATRTHDGPVIIPIRFNYNPKTNNTVFGEGRLTKIPKPKTLGKKRKNIRTPKLKRTECIVCECCGLQLQKHFGRGYAECSVEVHHKDDFKYIPDRGIAFNVDEDALIWDVMCHSMVTTLLQIVPGMNMKMATEYAKERNREMFKDEWFV